MGELVETLRQHDVKCVKAYCGVCGDEFLDTNKDITKSIYQAQSKINLLARKHRVEWDHDDVQVDVETTPEPEEIDAEVHVN